MQASGSFSAPQLRQTITKRLCDKRCTDENLRGQPGCLGIAPDNRSSSHPSHVSWGPSGVGAYTLILTCKKVTKSSARHEHLPCPRCQKNPRQKLAIKNGNADLALLLASRATILLVEYWRVLQCRASAQLSRLWNRSDFANLLQSNGSWLVPQRKSNVHSNYL